MRIGILDVKTGMLLDEDISLPEDQISVRKKTPLTTDLILQLTMAGITHLTIEDPDSTPENPDSSPAPVEKNDDIPERVPENSEAVLPRMSVIIDSNGFSASLEIEPSAADHDSLNITVEDLRQLLTGHGITHGINDARLAEIAAQWNSHKHKAAFDRAAVGTLPSAGKEGPCHFFIPHIANARDLETVRKSRKYWEAQNQVGTLHRAKKDSVVAEKCLSAPPQPGITVRGETVDSSEPVEEIIRLGEGVYLSKSGSEILAQTDGVLYSVNNTVGIIELDFNGSFELKTEKMAARLIVRAAGEGGSMPSEKELRGLLEQNKVVFGINEDRISEVMERIAGNDIPDAPVIIAEGLEPENGQNGKIEFLFNTQTSLAPKENPDGTVDYREVDIIVAVPKGKELVRLNPPTPGKPGSTVFGDPLPCKEGTPAILPAGRNTEAIPEQGVLAASIDGIVRYTGSMVEVTEGFIVKGDVDFSVGNIRYDKSVVINGDVKAGFSIDCGGDLQVSGIIEDCRVNVGGNVLCKHGFIGHGKGVIEANGDINLGFVLNQTVKSQKTVNIAKEAINASILARHEIIIHGKPLSVAGGSLTARDSIRVYTVGNHTGVQTTLEVGLDYTLLDELKKCEEMQTGTHDNQKKLAESIIKIQRKVIIGKELTVHEREIYDKIKTAIVKLEQQTALHEARKKHITEKMHELENAFIKIEHAGMPGTTFKIGESHHFCRDEVIGPKSVRMIKGEICIA